MVKFQEAVRDFAADKPDQESIVLPSMETFLRGIDCGEYRKEMALVYGMKKTGLNDEQIEEILMYSMKAWEPVEKESFNK